ncbi:hypothetical protein ACFQYP_43455 [Nonomuraea antimicrobica]
MIWTDPYSPVKKIHEYAARITAYGTHARHSRLHPGVSQIAVITSISTGTNAALTKNSSPNTVHAHAATTCRVRPSRT